MSTKNNIGPRFKKLIINTLLDTSEIPPVESFNLFLALKGKPSIPKYSKEIGVSPQAIYNDIGGGKKCPRFRNAFKKAFGDDPWAT